MRLRDIGHGDLVLLLRIAVDSFLISEICLVAGTLRDDERIRCIIQPLDRCTSRTDHLLCPVVGLLRQGCVGARGIQGRLTLGNFLLTGTDFNIGKRRLCETFRRLFPGRAWS